MNGWIFALALALATGVALFWRARPPRGVWELVAAAVLAGIAGYAWQGTPDLAGSPRAATAKGARFDAEAASLRLALTDRFGPAASWLAMSDGMARAGNSEDGANVLLSGLRQSPRDYTLWVGMGNALVQHEEGLLSPAADYAYRQALRYDARGIASRYFYGLALTRSGQLQQARDMWTALLPLLPATQKLRGEVQAKIGMIDQALAAPAGQ